MLRIPLVRAFWRDANWLARLNLLHAFAQNDIAAGAETLTLVYNLLDVEISCKTALDPYAIGVRELHVVLLSNTTR